VTEPQQGFAIGVDLGTSNTVAVVRWPDGRTRPLLVDGAPIMPSGVYIDENGRLHVGRDAYRLAGLDPSRFEPNPKRRIDEPTVLLGDREVATVDLLAAILAAVARAAVEAVGFLPSAVLTYPAAWGSRRRDALATAARRAGWPPVMLVPEPVAAARYFADVLRRPVPVGSALAVFDFGGGTFDVAVVRNDNGRFSVIGASGIEDLGGLDIDAAIVEHLGAVINETSADIWAGLRNPSSTTQRRDRRLFWDDVRGAKEMLSRTTVAPITVPGRDQAIHLTREELERVTEPLIRRAVWETGSAIQAAGLRPDQLAGLFLVGGSSRLPLAARLLHADLGIAPTVLEQPELPVAEGALAELVPVGAPTSYQTQSMTAASAAMPVSGYPASPAPSSAPVSPAFATSPVSSGFAGSPISAPPSAAYPMTAAQAIPPGHGPAPAPVGPPSGPPAAARRRRFGLLIAVAAAVVVLAVLAGGYFFFFRDRSTVIDFKTLSAAGSLDLADPAKIDSPITATLGDHTLVGWVADKTFIIAAYDLADKKKLWQQTITGDNNKWQLYANPGGVIVTGTGATAGGTLKLFAPSDGKLRKTEAFGAQDRLYFLDSVWVVHAYDAKKTKAFGWNGDTKWERADNPKGSSLVGQTNAGDLRGAADFTGAPMNRNLKVRKDIISVDGDDKIRLLDAGNGNEIRSWNNVGETYSTYTAFDGKLFVAGSSTKFTIQVYDLAKQTEPTQIYSFSDEKRQIINISPCGTDRICILDGAQYDGSDTVLRAISVADRKELWHADAKATEVLVPVGKELLATVYSGTPASELFNEDGKPLLKNEDKKSVGVRATNGSLLFFSAQLSTIEDDLALVGVTASTGERVALGTLPKTVGSSCSWNASRIACEAGGKLRVWSLAS
jgi:Ethanolamine utilization protein EutJ (predicted chaperonin)